MHSNNNYPFRTKRKSNPYAFLIVLLCIVLVLAVCFLPLPVRTRLTMSGTEYANDGSAIQTGTIDMDITVYHYLFQKDRAKINDIQLPGLNTSAQSGGTADVLIELPGPDADLQLLIWPLLMPDTQKYMWCDVFFDLNDPAYAVIRTESRIYAASEGDPPDYQTILQRYGMLGYCG